MFSSFFKKIASFFDFSTTKEWSFVMENKDSCPGYQVDGGCVPFSTELAKRMRASGFKPILLTWQWLFTSDAGTRTTGRHMVVAYEVKSGTWMMDNTAAGPVFVDRHENLTWAQRAKVFTDHLYPDKMYNEVILKADA